MREQVVHGARFVAEEGAQQRVHSGEESVVGGLAHAEGEAGHEFLLPCGDSAGTPFVSIDYRELDCAAGDLGRDRGDLFEGRRGGGGERGGPVAHLH